MLATLFEIFFAALDTSWATVFTARPRPLIVFYNKMIPSSNTQTKGSEEGEGEMRGNVRREGGK